MRGQLRVKISHRHIVKGSLKEPFLRLKMNISRDGESSAPMDKTRNSVELF